MLQLFALDPGFVCGEHRLLSFGGIEGGPKPETTEAPPDAPKSLPPEDAPPSIDSPPTEQDVDEGGGRVEKTVEERLRDQRNLGVTLKNIDVSKGNVEWDARVEQALRERLDAWLKVSIEGLLSYSSGALDRAQMRFISQQTRLVARLENTFQEIQDAGIQLLSQKIDANPNDPRYPYLRALVQDHIGRSNMLGREAGREGENLARQVDILDISLDEKQDIATHTPLDQPMSPDSEFALRQFDQDVEAQHALDMLVQGLTRRDGGNALMRLSQSISKKIGLGSNDNDYWEIQMARKQLDSMWKKMNPTQQKLCMQWLSDKLQAQNPPYKVERKGTTFSFEQG